MAKEKFYEAVDIPADFSMDEQLCSRIKRALEYSHGNHKDAAYRLGVSERTLSRLIKQYGL